MHGNFLRENKWFNGINPYPTELTLVRRGKARSCVRAEDAPASPTAHLNGDVSTSRDISRRISDIIFPVYFCNVPEKPAEEIGEGKWESGDAAPVVWGSLA